MQLNAALIVAVLAHVTKETHFLAQEEAVVQHATEEVPPVSTTMKAVINLTIQYFVLYTAVAVIKSYNELVKPESRSTFALKVCEAGCLTVNYAPMLSVLFIGVRMRALQLSQGEPDKHDLPQWWVKDSMLACAWSVLVQTILVLIVAVMNGEVPEPSEDGTPQVSGSGTVAMALSVIRYIAMLGLYAGFTTVIVGAFMMDPPAALWPDGVPPVSPAVGATMNLSAQYFGVYLGIQVCKTYQEFVAQSATVQKLSDTLHLATNTVNFAPMLCILFIGARMRALQIDPIAGNPQVWAQNCFYACAYSVLIQLLLIFATTFALGGSCKKEPGAAEGDVTFDLPEDKKTIATVLTATRFLVMLALYGGFTAVIVSVHVIEDKQGNRPPVSPAMQCVMNLTVQYFLVYLLLWVFLTVKQFVEAAKSMMTTCIDVVSTAKNTVKFCPMLCVLFIGLRLRALQITDQKGAPQGWAQQGMFLASYAVMFQLCMILLLGVIQGKPDVDEDGNPKTGGAGAMHYALTAFRYLSLLCVYGGAVTCVVALFKITPETATGEGSLIHPALDVPPPAGAPIL
jgi:hypothetical protein